MKLFRSVDSNLKDVFLIQRRSLVLPKARDGPFPSMAIALYGCCQGMISIVNTNRPYLRTMRIAEDSPIVGIIGSVYYLGCAMGAVTGSSKQFVTGTSSSLTNSS